MSACAICCAIVSCAAPSFRPTCPQWSEDAIEEFIVYRERRGETALVQAVLRDARVCAALAKL